MRSFRCGLTAVVAAAFGLFAFDASAATTSAAAGLNASSYVQKGLIAHWDGIENVAYGEAHDATATVWNDLKGGTTGIALDGTWTWAANGNGLAATRAKGVSLDGANKNVIGVAFRSGQFSCEVAYDQTETTPESTEGYKKKVAIFFAFNSVNSWMGLENDRYAGFNANGAFRAPGFATLAQGGACRNDVGDTMGRHTLSCVQKGTNFWDYFDSAVFAGSVTGALTTAYSKPVQFNRHNDTYNDSGLNGTYHAMRVYDRPLSADDVKLNHAIDQVRFFGADPQDVELPEGFRFNDGALEVKVSFSSAEGSVTDAEGHDLWVPFNGSTTVTVKATPAAGYEFVRWDGLVTIERSVLLSPTVTVKAAQLTPSATPVRAVFRRIGAKRLSARSYIPEGLLNLWDGKENAGYGVHSDTLTAWTDLVGGHNLTLPAAPFISITDDGFQGASYTTIDKGVTPDGVREGSVTQFTVGEGVRTGRAAVSRHQTIECAYYQGEEVPLAKTSKERGFVSMLWIGHEGFCFGLMWNNSFCFNTHEESQDATMNWRFETDTTLGMRSFSCAQNGSNWWIRVDGAAGKEGVITADKMSTYIYGSRAATGFNFKYPYYYPSNNPNRFGFNGVYHCMRFYNRALSLEEVQVNRIVDCIRYFGGDPADFTLPDGWRFDTTDGIALERRCAIVPVANGTFTVDGAEVTAATEVWFEQGEGKTMALAATPAAGLSFSHWEGVADEDRFKPSGSLKVTGRTLKPVFRLPAAAGEGVYKGLVYDMALDLKDATRVYNAVENSKDVTRTYAQGVGTLEYAEEEMRSHGSYDDNPQAERPVVKLTSPSNVVDAAVTQRRSGLRLADWSPADEMTARVVVKWDSWVNNKDYYDVPLFTCGYDANAMRGVSIGIQINKNYRYSYFYVKIGGKKYTSVASSLPDFAVLVEPGAQFELMVSVRKLEGASARLKLAFVNYNNVDTITLLDTVVDLSHEDELRPLHGFMQVGTDTYDSIGDAEPQASLGGFTGGIAKMQVWDRMLSDDEIRLLSTGATGEKWSIGAFNGRADEFAADGSTEAEPVFDVDEMAWRQLPKALTAAKPSVTLKGVLNPSDSITESGYVKFLSLYPVEATLPATAKVEVRAGGVLVGTLDLAAGERTIALRRGQVRADAAGDISITLTREGTSTGDIEIDALSLSGGEQFGKADGKTSEFNRYATASGAEALGALTTKHVHNQVRNDDTYRNLSYYFNVPARVAEESGLDFTTGIYSSGPTSFKAYVNDSEIPAYVSPAGGTVKGDVVSFKVPKGELKPGLNRIHFHRDDDDTSADWTYFEYLRFKFDAPPTGLLMLVR